MNAPPSCPPDCPVPADDTVLLAACLLRFSGQIDEEIFDAIVDHAQGLNNHPRAQLAARLRELLQTQVPPPPTA